jgi:hypothetical protein
LLLTLWISAYLVHFVYKLLENPHIEEKSLKGIDKEGVMCIKMVKSGKMW